MCEYCDDIGNEIMKNSEPAESIFYNEREDKYYLIVEQARYERFKVEIKHCYMCGKKLNLR